MPQRRHTQHLNTSHSACCAWSITFQSGPADELARSAKSAGAAASAWAGLELRKHEPVSVPVPRGRDRDGLRKVWGGRSCPSHASPSRGGEMHTAAHPRLEAWAVRDRAARMQPCGVWRNAQPRPGRVTTSKNTAVCARILMPCNWQDAGKAVEPNWAGCSATHDF
jgi:hypothetical protein